MTKLHVSPKCGDKTGDTLYQSKEIRLDGSTRNVSFTTPVVAMDVREIRRTDNIAPSAMGINEIFRSPPTKNPSNMTRKEQQLPPFHELVFNAEKQHQFNLDLHNQSSKLPGLSVFFFEYKGEKYPSEVEREFILDTQYSYSDITCLPLTPILTKNLTKDADFRDYLNFMKECIEYLKSFNQKPIMGLIPNIAYGYLSDLIKLYVEKDVSAFCIDFDCHTPMSHKPALTKCYRVLMEYDHLDASFFYGLNVNSGHFIRNKPVVNAKDILSFGFGLDAMGKRHRTKIDFKKIKEKMGSRWVNLDREENKARLFIKNDYGYYKAEKADTIKNYPLDSSIPLSAFTDNFSVKNLNIRHFEKIFNMEQLGLEASKLRHIIEDDAPTKYLSKKQYVDPKDIKQIRGFKDSVANTQLSFEELL